MRFRLNCIIKSFPIPTNQKLAYTLNEKNALTVYLRSPKSTEKGYHVQDAVCFVTADLKIKDQAMQFLEEILKNEVSVPIATPKSYHKLEDGTKVEIPALKYYPPPFQDYLKSVRKKLIEPVKSLISILRWRFDLEGPPEPIRVRGLDWTKNEKVWHPTPMMMSIDISIKHQFQYPELLDQFILDQVNDLKQEPVYHELFREAWLLRHDNSRSSLVIGIAAAEVGIKNLISRVEPKAEWLIENSQSPPIISIIQEYLPIIIPSLQKKSSDLLLKKLTKSIEKGVFARNEIVHKGKSAPSSDSLEDILINIKKLLYVIDYLCGNNWAKEKYEAYNE